MEWARATNYKNAFRGQAGYWGFAYLIVAPALLLASPIGLINTNLGSFAFMALMYPLDL